MLVGSNFCFICEEKHYAYKDLDFQFIVILCYKAFFSYKQCKKIFIFSCPIKANNCDPFKNA